MFFGIILACSTMNPTECQFLSSARPFSTLEDCEIAATEVRPPQGVYIAGTTCMAVEFLDPGV